MVSGKSIMLGGQGLTLRGVTYGPFRPDETGGEYPQVKAAKDFAIMAAAGINAVRLYTVPPRWLLDLAGEHDLRILVGLPWEQHIAFLESRRQADDIARRVGEGVRQCAGHPAVLGYAVGNEIPTHIVRWFGQHRVERFIERLCDQTRDIDPGGLVTYANYPSTEYLHLPFLDFLTFNIYLERQRDLDAYLRRLQNIAADQPLVIGEIGLDSHRNGLERQAETIQWQIGSIFAAGCAGAFVFSWTDEWHRGGQDILDWDFGLTDRQRQPKPALASASRAFAQVPFPDEVAWPKASVLICTYNGSKTIRQCLEAATRLDYPNYEVIVVNDGSKDHTADIAREFNVRMISTPNRGLSCARNTALHAATGEIVAYIDDDAYPDRHWLKHLAWAFAHSGHVGVGGPNISPPEDPFVPQCVARSPGNPAHVLLTDTLAEHIPGCNMAFRREALLAIGGFDEQFRIAGDDVDICWRLQEAGGTLGFSAGAVVWHHRRRTVRTYWRQQVNYGAAEGALERKWPEKYNATGHLSWSGRMYDASVAPVLRLRYRQRVYHGTWGTGLFQSVYNSAPSLLWSLPTMPEWYILLMLLGGAGLLGLVYRPMLWAWATMGAGLAISFVLAGVIAAHMPLPAVRSRWRRLGWRSLIAALHVLQPLARLVGRLKYGLTPWRRRGPAGFALPLPRRRMSPEEQWRPTEDRLAAIEESLKRAGACGRRGGQHDRWDLEVRGGVLASARLRMTVEEHGQGKQCVRAHAWPRWSRPWLVVLALLGALGALMGLDRAWMAMILCLLPCAVLLVRGLFEAGVAMHGMMHAMRSREPEARTADEPDGRPTAASRKAARQAMAAERACV